MSEDTVNVQIGPDLVRPIIQAKINTAIHEALGRNPQELISAIVHTAMNYKVDKDGNLSKYSSDNKHTYLQAMTEKAIREEAKKALSEVMDEQRPAIKEAVKKVIMGSRGANKIATAIVAGLAEGTKCQYTSKINISFNTPKEGY